MTLRGPSKTVIVEPLQAPAAEPRPPAEPAAPAAPPPAAPQAPEPART
jgi:hypothetical protein